MRRNGVLLWKVPKNRSVAPQFDVWNEKYEPWAHMKRMGKIVGTGFYIPPEWYNHFRMFPPMHHNFQQEKTLNPQNASEPTQDDRTSISAERLKLRDELARKSRALATEGMRYYNLFWVQKPLDAMERQYFRLQKQGVPHNVAIKKVLQEFYDSLAVKQRVAHIQSEEAKLSGGFITMREATTVLAVLAQLQKEQLTPHQVATLAADRHREVQSGDIVQGTAETVVAAAATPAAAPTATTDAAPSTTDVATSAKADDATAVDASATEAMNAAALSAMLDDEAGSSAPTSSLKVTVKDSPSDSLPKLRQTATDETGDFEWFGMGVSYDIPIDSPATPAPATTSPK
ncbi:Hypothetical protein, putative [Bodo saltans]|uniref:Uncharacterized protein n=1 Tax=Bodo saltans TaxID=75058 RepID=A0A0S4KJ11_BODSA|nr:Hypothetical protein, putative [Bodo saltans]|eukprot:CUI14568.1 Hypothetical protein, putative [Bodo saltans]